MSPQDVCTTYLIFFCSNRDEELVIYHLNYADERNAYDDFYINISVLTKLYFGINLFQLNIAYTSPGTSF